jgi:hypothetical protein
MEIKPKRNAKPAKDATVADAGARVVEALAGAAGDVPPAERGQTVRLLIEGVAVVAAVQLMIFPMRTPSMKMGILSIPIH